MERYKFLSATLLVLMLLSCGETPGGQKVLPPTPTPVIDSDGDGLSDEVEEILGTDPAKADTDGDGLSDSREIAAGDPKTYDPGEDTIPTDSDTDNDGYLDKADVNPWDRCIPDDSDPVCTGGNICDIKPWMPSCL